jgi:hypothetical protein
MAAKKIKGQVKAAIRKKPPARKQAALRTKDAGYGTGDSIVDAARRLWLSADSSATSRISPPESVRRLGTRFSG